MKRLLTIMCIAFISVAATVRSDDIYLRAVIVYGKAGEGKQVMAEFERATALYGVLLRGLLGGSEYGDPSKLKTRPCLHVAYIMLNPSNRDVPADLLDVNSTPFHSLYYPALNGEPALNRTGHVMRPELVELLPKYNEEFLKRPEYPPCDARR